MNEVIVNEINHNPINNFDLKKKKKNPYHANDEPCLSFPGEGCVESLVLKFSEYILFMSSLLYNLLPHPIL